MVFPIVMKLNDQIDFIYVISNENIVMKREKKTTPTAKLKDIRRKTATTKTTTTKDGMFE